MCTALKSVTFWGESGRTNFDAQDFWDNATTFLSCLPHQVEKLTIILYFVLSGGLFFMDFTRKMDWVRMRELLDRLPNLVDLNFTIQCHRVFATTCTVLTLGEFVGLFRSAVEQELSSWFQPGILSVSSAIVDEYGF